MSPQGLHAVPPPRRVPTVLTVDAGSTGALTPRFLALVVRARHEAQPEPRSVDERPAA